MSHAPAPAEPAAVAAPPAGGMAALFAVVFVSLVGFGVIIPVFPFFGIAVGAGPMAITLAMACYSVGQFVGAPIWGRLSDRFGRKTILVATTFGAVLAYLAMAEARTIEQLALIRFVGGFMFGNIAVCYAYATDVTTPQTRPKALGLLGAAFGLGFVVGPALGGLIAGQDPTLEDFARVAHVSAAIAALAGLAALVFLQESRGKAVREEARAAPRVRTMALLRSRPALSRLVVLNLAVVAAAALMESSFAIWAADRLDWGPMEVGVGFFLMGIVLAAVQGGATGALSKRFPEGVLVRAGLAVYAVGVALLVISESDVAAYAGLVVTALGVGVFSPTLSSLAAGTATEDDRGAVMGLFQGASSFGRILGPAVSGAIYEASGPAAPFAVSCVAMLAALALAFTLPTPRKETA